MSRRNELDPFGDMTAALYDTPTGFLAANTWEEAVAMDDAATAPGGASAATPPWFSTNGSRGSRGLMDRRDTLAKRRKQAAKGRSERAVRVTRCLIIAFGLMLYSAAILGFVMPEQVVAGIDATIGDSTPSTALPPASVPASPLPAPTSTADEQPSSDSTAQVTEDMESLVLPLPKDDLRSDLLAYVQKVRELIAKMRTDMLKRWDNEELALYYGMAPHGQEFVTGRKLLRPLLQAFMVDRPETHAERLLNDYMQVHDASVPHGVPQTYVVGVSGSSNAAGHDNNHNQGFPVRLEDQMHRELFQPLNATFKVYNQAMSGHGEAHTELCLQNYLGGDIDLALWEFSMFESGLNRVPYEWISERELFARQCMLANERRADVFYVRVGGGRGRNKDANGKLEDLEPMTTWEGRYAMAYDPVEAVLAEQYSRYGIHLHYLMMGRAVNFYDHRPTFDHAHLFVNWHPGPPGHQLIADILQQNLLAALSDALTELEIRVTTMSRAEAYVTKMPGANPDSSSRPQWLDYVQHAARAVSRALPEPLRCPPSLCSVRPDCVMSLLPHRGDAIHDRIRGGQFEVAEHDTMYDGVSVEQFDVGTHAIRNESKWREEVRMGKKCSQGWNFVPAPKTGHIDLPLAWYGDASSGWLDIEVTTSAGRPWQLDANSHYDSTRGQVKASFKSAPGFASTDFDMERLAKAVELGLSPSLHHDHTGGMIFVCQPAGCWGQGDEWANLEDVAEFRVNKSDTILKATPLEALTGGHINGICVLAAGNLPTPATHTLGIRVAPEHYDKHVYVSMVSAF